MPSDSCHPNAKYDSIRANMVAAQIEARGVQDPAILAAMATVPRERFVSANHRHKAYTDQPLAISHGQTISQPYIVAAMIELAAVESRSRVLEIGTGSGYQTAVLAELGADVYSIEVLPPLAEHAADVLNEQGWSSAKLHLRIGDGYDGWPDAAPFDAIIVSAAAPTIPPPLTKQLAPCGRLVIPIGADVHERHQTQELLLVTATAKGIQSRSIFPVRFVPMTGRARDA